MPRNPVSDPQKRHAVDHWEIGTASELRRVLYVGASRAEQLLIVAVHDNHLQRVLALLDRYAAPYLLHREET